MTSKSEILKNKKNVENKVQINMHANFVNLNSFNAGKALEYSHYQKEKQSYIQQFPKNINGATIKIKCENKIEKICRD